ncbi:MAG: helix-hairpin-helix domain-containing protein [Candidatus Freyarchaeota archaeon]
MVSFIEILIYFTTIAVATLMAVIGDRLGLSKIPASKVVLTRDSPVTDIKGIGEATAKILHRNKIKTVDDLINANSKELGKAKGLTVKQVKKWQKYALKATMED